MIIAACQWPPRIVMVSKAVPNAYDEVAMDPLLCIFTLCSAWTMVPGTVTPATCITKGNGSRTVSILYSLRGVICSVAGLAREPVCLSAQVLRATCARE